ncbi:MAG: hypothetical protein IT550_08010 [Novosphingobium sp.]|nr:hypothetical protein [Novosphingobium sp.]
MTLNSVYIANNAGDVLAAEDWLGGNLDAIQLVGGFANWWDWSNSPSWIASQVQGTSPDVLWSIGLIPWGASLAEAAKGSYNDKYLALAQNLASIYQSDDQIHIRLGWEFNGKGWFPWSAQGKEADYVGAFRQFVDAFRSVSDKFVFEWTPNAGSMGMDVAAAYPGDDYVDVIGMDFYYNIAWDPADPLAAWNWYVKQPYGLQWQQDFATAHGKQTAIGEWGVNSDTAGPFIALAAKWFEDHGMLYQNYWNSNADFAGTLSSGQYPTAAAAFLAAFGQAITVPSDTSTPLTLTGSDIADALAGHDGNDTIHGNGGNDLLGGGAGNDALYGDAGDDTLDGGEGDDILDGGAGADSMTGGRGNDVYYVDNVLDRVIEAVGSDGGVDTVFSSVSYDLLGTAVEVLQLTGSANLNAFGNAQANTLIGNAGNNVLDGRAGADAMQGGAGNDTYYVDDAGDTVIELAGEGTDTVYASVSYDLAGISVETLQLTGTGNISATGNDAANTLIGNSGSNVLDGRGGADVMQGGAGDDVYFVDNVGDKVIELQGKAQGYDKVYASVSHSLAATFVEYLELTGTGNINADGNSQINTLVGNAGDNRINGKGNNDTLTGNGGNDTFIVANAGNVTITDFGKGDLLDLSRYKGKVTVSDHDGGALLKVDQNTSVLLLGVDSHLLSAAAGGVFTIG